MKSIFNIKSRQDIIGALVDLGAGACLIENEDQAQQVYESIQHASSRREIERNNDEFRTSMEQLDLSEANTPAHIYGWVDGNACLICLSGDWE